MKESDFKAFIDAGQIAHIAVFSGRVDGPFEIWAYQRTDGLRQDPFTCWFAPVLPRLLLHSKTNEPRRFQVLRSATNLVGRLGWSGPILLDIHREGASAPAILLSDDARRFAEKARFAQVLEALRCIGDDLRENAIAAARDAFDERAAAFSEAAFVVNWYTAVMHREIGINPQQSQANGKLNRH